MLSELAAAFHWLRLYRALPLERLRIFSFSSREEMNEQLVRENQGRLSPSVTAAQFLHKRMISSSDVAWEASTCGIPGNERAISIALIAEPPLDQSAREARPLAERGMSILESLVLLILLSILGAAVNNAHAKRIY